MADIGNLLLPELDRPSPQDVVRAYLLILGRRPESQATIDAQCALPDLVALGEQLLCSDEFRARFAHELLSAPLPVAAAARPATIVPLLRLMCGAGGDAEGLLGEGWSVGELDGRWTVGAESVLRLPVAAAHEEYLLRLELKPYHTPKMLRVEAGGVTVLHERVRHQTVLVIRIAGELVSADGMLRLRLRHAAPERPCDHSSSRDDRALAVKLVAVSLEGLDRGGPPVDPGALAAGFESLGEDCAFGFYETAIGRTSVSLLRYNSVALAQLVQLLENRLEGFPDAGRACLAAGSGDEYIFREGSIGLVGHTGFSRRGELAADEGLLLRRQLKRMLFLKRMFNQRVDGDGTIFVYRAFGPEPLGAVLPVWQALRRRGRNALLWVCDADELRPCGSVERLEDGLLRGYVDPTLAGIDLGSPRMLAWAVICRRAWRLWEAVR